MKATSLQGNLSQNRRQEALDGFRTGKYRIMVATDIAARGIDCARVTHVVNFDVPDTAENYTHRIGRTGRADRSGEAMTMITSADDDQVRAIERNLRERLPRVRLDGFLYENETVGSDSSFEEPRQPRPGRGTRAPRSGAPRAAEGGRRAPGPGRSRSGKSDAPRRPARSPRPASGSGDSVFGLASGA
jgi:superfamily II DNA/RNA helicase